jgi:hypothetical protein
MTTSNPSKNALSHGAYSSEAVLPWENKQEFNDLHEELRKDFFPDGRAQEDAVYDLACLHWKKRRLRVGSQLAFRRDRDISGLAEAGRNNGWDGIADYFANTLDNNESKRGEMRDLIKSLSEVAVASYKHVAKQLERILAHDGTNREGKESALTQLEKLNELMREVKAGSSLMSARLQALEGLGLEERPCERAYRPDVMEKELKILAEIDKRFEKTIAHLVRLKEYKNMYIPREVKALPAETIGLPAKQP